VQVVDFAIAASIAARPFVCRSPTASAAQRTFSSESDARRAYNALRLKPTIVFEAEEEKEVDIGTTDSVHLKHPYW
jgi:hypothetical protein